MDINAVRKEITTNLVKQGLLEKQSKFLKELRNRWIVLTTNYLMCFRNQDCADLTDIIDLKHVITIKSHFQRTQLGTGFKVSSDDISLCFRCTSASEKWCWLVALERTVQLKQRGSTQFNSQQMLRTKGLPSVEEYQGGQMVLTQFVNLQSEPSATPRGSMSRRTEFGKESRIGFGDYLNVQEQTVRRGKAKSSELLHEQADKATQTEQQKLMTSSSTSPMRKGSLPAVRPKYTDKHDIINSHFMIGLFDQFESSSEVLRRLILDLIIKIANNKELGLNEFLLCECRVHPNSPVLAKIFTSIYTRDIESEAELVQGLGLLQVILQHISDFFVYDQLQKLKSLLLRSLSVLKREGSLLLALNSIDLIDCLDSYREEQVAAIVKQVGQLQHTASNDQPFKEFLKNFHRG